MNDAEATPQGIPENSPRLGLEDQFAFRCDPSLGCFTRCCHDVSILLTPYDVLRLKNALQLDSSEFLQKYTLVMQSEEKKIPVVFLNMDASTRNCPFVSQQGCGVYAHRPWACRMYPLGLAEPEAPDAAARRFYFVIRESLCDGHNASAACSVRDWIADQGIEPYELMQSSYQQLMYLPGWSQRDALTPQKMSMYFMACYDLDRFRRFVFETRFLEVFDVEDTRVEALRTDDEELLVFAFDWLAFTLFHERRMKLKKNVVACAATAEPTAEPDDVASN
jgi:Fe-S-cluster containining protein